MVHTIKVYAILIAFLFCLSFGAAFPAAETAVEGITDAITATMATTDGTETGGSGHHLGPADIGRIVGGLLGFALVIAWFVASRRWPAIRPDSICRIIIEGVRIALNRCRQRRQRPAAEAEPEVELDWLEGEVPTEPPPAYTPRV
ncbi:hypothetical protein N7528_004637 [Penicillium herquei]|nr:hypothetical protein N7528_004637 [Penicillium herquei]